MVDTNSRREAWVESRAAAATGTGSWLILTS